MPAWPRRMPPRRARAAAATRARGRRRGLPAGLHQPDLRHVPRATARRAALPEALVAVSARAGRPVWIPADVAGHCCATPWSSKGFRDGHALMAARTADALWRWSEGGALPVVSTPAPARTACERGRAALDDERRERFAQRRACSTRSPGRTTACCRSSRCAAGSPRRPSTRPARRATSASQAELEALARALADEVVVPLAATCCGMAGDRGLLHPELTARRPPRDEAARGRRRAPSTPTCAPTAPARSALAAGDRPPVRSFVQLLEEATRP